MVNAWSRLTSPGMSRVCQVCREVRQKLVLFPTSLPQSLCCLIPPALHLNQGRQFALLGGVCDRSLWMLWDAPWQCSNNMVGLVAQSCLTLVTPWTISYQAPLSMGFSRQEYWSGLPFPSPGDLLYPGIKPRSPALQQIHCRLSYKGLLLQLLLLLQSSNKYESIKWLLGSEFQAMAQLASHWLCYMWNPHSFHKILNSIFDLLNLSSKFRDTISLQSFFLTVMWE